MSRIVISDYAKGFLSETLLSEILELARTKKFPIIVDPKGDDFSKYSGATVLKPNLAEAYAAAKMPPGTPLESVAKTVLERCNAELLLITRSESGMSLYTRKGEAFHFPVRLKEVKDVTGAGDTVLAMISIALANGLDIKYGAQLANIAAGLAIEKLGCARISLSEMAERLLEFDVENKIFDEQHSFALQQALQGRSYSVLGLESTQGMTTAVFRSTRELASQDSDQKLIVYLCDPEPDEEFISLLSSLSEVDFIVLQSESLHHLCEVIHPRAVLVMEGGRLIALDHAKALLNRARESIVRR